MDMKELLTLCYNEKASDLHLSPNQPPLLRIDGDLIPAKDYPPLNVETINELVYSTMDDKLKSDLKTLLEVDYATELKDIARFRVNVFHQIMGLAAVFRVIPTQIPTLEDLHLPDVFKGLLDLPNGLILVTGPTGSGKSTTLAAMVDHINMTQSSHIITIEDPIEFVHSSKKCLVNQRQVVRDTHDFANALRSALREDPDVLLVGEMRDLETVRLALTAAETGHLVLATLHTSSAPRTISRIVDVFPAGEKNVIRNMLSESLQAVICQTLLKKVGGGRVAAFEIMLGTPAIRNLIREDKVAQMYTSIQTGAAIGMCTLDQYLQDLVNKQLITTKVAHEAALDKTHFAP
ncbi:MAG: type IV pilus twitching motility protein PilT [Gammaproteobacteria bacterium]|nr:type IV pilus twitching motility protein PilT [Gammaproteobacteria bacterium]